MSYDVIIVGGGVAGLSAAVDLSSRGYKILLLEQRPRLGGRTYSFIDETTGDVVDNGQHLLMGCYHETRSYLRQIGSDQLATLQPNLHIDFLQPRRGFASLSCPPLPPPLHISAALLGLRTLSLADRIKLFRVGLELQFTSKEREQKLEFMTVEEWLISLGQSVENRKYLWDIIAIGSLNDHPRNVSALLFFRVLRAAFTGRRQNSSLLIPRVGLTDLLIDPAARFIRNHKGEIRTSTSVKRVKVSGSEAKSVIIDNGTTLKAKSFIIAVPHYAATNLFTPLFHHSITPVPALPLLQSSPIITINLWLDKQVLEKQFVALLDSRVQWVFNKTRILAKTRPQYDQYLSLVMSGAAEYVELDKKRLVEIAMDDLGRALPHVSKVKVLHSFVVKEKRATFLPKPGTEALRPGARTDVKNVFLAGDWTDTGYPATIEGAVLSGRRAAKAAVAL